jgi:hypothetical protein
MVKESGLWGSRSWVQTWWQIQKFIPLAMHVLTYLSYPGQKEILTVFVVKGAFFSPF